jgi:transposase
LIRFRGHRLKGEYGAHMSAEKKPRRARRSFTDEYKAAAVRLVLEEGKQMTQVARDLDLTETSLREWVGQARADQKQGRPGSITTSEREELTQLRRRVRELEEDRAILKKAAVDSIGPRNRWYMITVARCTDGATRSTGSLSAAEDGTMGSVETRRVP